MNISPWAALHLMAWGLGAKAIADLRSEFEPDARTWFLLNWGVRLCLAAEAAAISSQLSPGLPLFSTSAGILAALSMGMGFRCLEDDICSGRSCRLSLADKPRLMGWIIAGAGALCVIAGAAAPGLAARLAARLSLLQGGSWLAVSAWLMISLYRFHCTKAQSAVYTPRAFATPFFFAFLHSLLRPFARLTGVEVPTEAADILGALFVLTLVMNLYAMVIRVRNKKLVDALTQLHEFERNLFKSEKLAAVGIVAAGAAHDFNNWLAVILGYADVLLRDTDISTAETQRVAETIKRTVNRATATLRQLAGLGRADGEKGPAGLRQAVEEPLDLLARDLGRRKIEVTRHLEDVPAVSADLNLVSQVCLNLYINARDAMTDGGVLDVSLRSRADDGQLLITVRDSGPGIPDGFKQKIFEPFQTTKGAKGTGLGLSASRSAIRAMGGDMGFDSTPGRGATFWVRLPPSSGRISGSTAPEAAKEAA